MASFALEHLTFTYPGQTRPALSDLTLTIPEGAVTVLCGESGSGKSTLLRQLKTCLTPHGTVSGAVRLGDALLKGIPFAERCEIGAHRVSREERARILRHGGDAVA